MTTLVLDRSNLEVRADGAALALYEGEERSGTVPLKLLERVVIQGNIRLDTGVLTKLAEAGIATLLLSKRQTRRLLALPEGNVCYNNWLRAARMSLLHAWRHRREQAGEPIAEEEFHELIHRHLYQPELENHAFVRAGPYAGALLARVLQALHQAGLKPRYWGRQGRPIELAADIAQLLGLSLYLDMRGFMDQVQGDNAALLYLLHQAGSRLETGLAERLGSLHRRVKIRVEEWR